MDSMKLLGGSESLEPQGKSEDSPKTKKPDEKHISPLSLVKRGLRIVDQEMARFEKMVEDKTPFKNSDADVLKDYIKVCSHVAKEHKDLNVDSFSSDDLERLESHEFADKVLKAAKVLGITPETVNRIPGKSKEPAEEDKITTGEIEDDFDMSEEC